MAECIECGDTYLTDEDVLKAILCNISQLTTGSTAIQDKLNETCLGAPINVNVCNQVDLTNVETYLNEISLKLTSIDDELVSIVANTDDLEALVSTVITRLDSQLVLIQAGNATLAQIKTEVDNVNLNLVAITGLLTDIDANTDGLESLITSTNLILQNTQNLIQSEFDETQVLITQSNAHLQNTVTALSGISISASDTNIKLDEIKTKLDSVITNLTPVSRNIDFVQVIGAGIKSTLAGVVSLAISFRGSGGTLKGISIPDGTTVQYSNENNLMPSIDYTVPTGGEQRVLISYVKV